MENVKFFAFPTKKKDPRLRSKWLEMIRKPLGYDPKPHHRVCSRHFSEGSKVPDLFAWNNYGEFQPGRSMAAVKKREALTELTQSEVNNNTNGTTVHKGNNNCETSQYIMENLKQ